MVTDDIILSQTPIKMIQSLQRAKTNDIKNIALTWFELPVTRLHKQKTQAADHWAI